MKRIKRKYRVARYVVYRQTVVNPADHFWTFVGSLFGIGLIGLIQTYNPFISDTDQLFLIGSFGATAVLLYGAANSPLAQPRNLIGGHLLSALVGVTVFKLVGNPAYLWAAAALAVSISIVLMQVTKTLHPPGGATALIAIIGSDNIKSMGYYYVLSPVLVGVVVLFAVAILVNNIPENRHYPYKRTKRIFPRKKHTVRQKRNANAGQPEEVNHELEILHS